MSSLERKHGWAWVQGAGIPGLAAIVPLAFFVENYRTIVNLSHILSRACLGGESGERGNFPGQDTGQ